MVSPFKITGKKRKVYRHQLLYGFKFKVSIVRNRNSGKILLYSLKDLSITNVGTAHVPVRVIRPGVIQQFPNAVFCLQQFCFQVNQRHVAGATHVPIKLVQPSVGF